MLSPVLDKAGNHLTLEGEAYAEAGVYRRGDMAASALLAGFAVPVAALLDAE